MISSFSIGNFKAFGPNQKIPIKPITLIYGPNSAGKSSIIHALLLGRHALDHNAKLDVFKTDVGGDSVDLGGFRQYVFRRNLQNVVSWGAGLPAVDLSPRLKELLPADSVGVSIQWEQPLNDVGEPIEGSAPQIIAAEFTADSELIFRLSRRPNRRLQIDRTSPQVLARIAEAILAAHSLGTSNIGEHVNDLAVPLAQIASEVRFESDDFFPKRVLGHDGGALGQVVPLSKATREEDLLSTAQLVGPRLIAELVSGLSNAFAYQLGRTTYLGPLRSYPPRHLAFAEDHDRNWRAGGGFAWDVLRADTGVREAVNRWLSAEALQTKYQVEIRTLTAVEMLEEPIRDTLEEVKIDVIEEGQPPMHDFDGDLPVWGIADLDAEASRFVRDLRRRAPETISELVLLDIVQKTPVSHRDVGIGISQVLPVLVHAHADWEQLIAIEQPEIHLHPALQSELADVFIESALGKQKNTFIIETHSEHLVLRVMRRIRETHMNKLPTGCQSIAPDDVAILFVQPTAQGSEVKQLRVDKQGRLIDPWPGGFFEEAFSELF